MIGPVKEFDPTKLPTRAECFDGALAGILRRLLHMHRAEVHGNGRDPDKYESAYSLASREISAAADKLPHRKAGKG